MLMIHFEWQVEVAVNDQPALNLSMKVGDAGEAFFVVETDVGYFDFFRCTFRWLPWQF